jgi:hypothetical protein
VIMVARPGTDLQAVFYDPAKVVDFILRHQPTRRGV